MTWFFGDYIRRTLEEREWTVAKLAKKMRMAHSYVGALIRGGRSNDKNPPKVSVDTLIQLAKALKVPEMDLLNAYKGIDPASCKDEDLKTFDLVREIILATAQQGRDWEKLSKSEREALLKSVQSLNRKFVSISVEHELSRL